MKGLSKNPIGRLNALSFDPEVSGPKGRVNPALWRISYDLS